MFLCYFSLQEGTDQIFYIKTRERIALFAITQFKNRNDDKLLAGRTGCEACSA